jgi:hypothetical protein
MAGFDQYQAIPGHNARFKDGNLNLKNDPNPPTTESVLFLGTATDGPIMQPVNVNPDNVNVIFGKMVHDNGIPNGATLVAKFEEAWNAGNRDIRLMRVTGESAAASLVGASYTNTHEEVAEDTLDGAVGRGNSEATFTLPHGGIQPSTFVLTANGAVLPNTAYVLSEGTQEDLSTSTAAVPAEVQLLENVTDMEAEIMVSYTYDYVDVDGSATTAEVIDNNTDNSGLAMIASGEDVVITLDHVAKAGSKLYVAGAEVTGVFDVVGDQLTIHSTDKIKLGDKLELSYGYDVVEVIEPSIELTSIYGGAVYNGAKVKVDVEEGLATITISKPESKKSIMSEQPLVFKSSDFPTFQLMANAINSHPLNNVVRANTDFNDIYVNTLQVKPETAFSGGKDELNLSKEDMYKRLGGEKNEEGFIEKQGAYQLLENYQVDYVVPLGVFADDKLIGKYDNFAYQLALACAVMSHYNSVTIGLISTSTPSDASLASVEKYVQKLEAMPNEYYMRDRMGALIKDGEGNMIDLGQFIQVVAGPDVVVRNSRLGQVASVSPASYVGMVSGLPAQSAPTNKPMPSVIGLRFEYSTSQLNRLTKNRFVTFRYKPNGQVGVVDSMTAAHQGSDYTRLSTARIVKEAINLVREIADPFIGEPNDAANRNALTSAVDKGLNRMVEAKALLGFEFSVIATPQMELIGEGAIELGLQAPNELRRLTTIVSLNA